jgi:hypothetical protein
MRVPPPVAALDDAGYRFNFAMIVYRPDVERHASYRGSTVNRQLLAQHRTPTADGSNFGNETPPPTPNLSVAVGGGNADIPVSTRT